MSDNLSFLLTCAAECLNNWGYNGHGKHVDDGVKEITRLRAENEKLRFERDTIGEANYVNGWNDAINSSEAMQDLRKALLYVYDNSLGLDPDKITDDIEWVTAEIRAARKALEDKQ